LLAVALPFLFFISVVGLGFDLTYFFGVSLGFGLVLLFLLGFTYSSLSSIAPASSYD